MENYKMVSLIPARGGSERIPRKNIKMMAGKPMLAWTIEASLKSKYVNRTFVSTEDSEIKEVAMRYGAEVIDRPKKYASDNYSHGLELFGVLQHFRETLWDRNHYPDYLAWLYPTNPLRTAEEIDGVYELILEKRNPVVVTAKKWKNPLYAEEYFEKDENGNWFMPMGYPSCKYTHLRNAKERTLYFKERYLPTSSVWIAPFRSFILGAESIYNRDIGLYIVDREDVDVDTPFDFKVAEMLLEERMGQKHLTSLEK